MIGNYECMLSSWPWLVRIAGDHDEAVCLPGHRGRRNHTRLGDEVPVLSEAPLPRARLRTADVALPAVSGCLHARGPGRAHLPKLWRADGAGRLCPGKAPAQRHQAQEAPLVLRGAVSALAAPSAPKSPRCTRQEGRPPPGDPKWLPPEFRGFLSHVRTVTDGPDGFHGFPTR